MGRISVCLLHACVCVYTIHMGAEGDSQEKDYLLPGRPVCPHVQPQQIKMQPSAAAREGCD